VRQLQVFFFEVNQLNFRLFRIKFDFHFIPGINGLQVANNIVFLCMTDADAGSDRVRVPYAFLEDIKDEFGSTYGDRAQVNGAIWLFNCCLEYSLLTAWTSPCLLSKYRMTNSTR